tara:strand:- start:429 stop:1625 length:1197 start_codon:yes stop_codon:yes gene_type:complete
MIQGLAAIPYVGAVALGTAIGINTTGKSVLEISNAITKKIQENPEIINTPQFKGLAFAMGLRIPGVIAPDADEMEKVRQDIEKNLKPGETKPVDMPSTTGETTPPEIDTTEKFPLPEEKLPILEGFPIDEKQLPTIFETRGIGDNNPPSPIEDTDTPSSLAKENLNKKLLKETDADDKRAIEYLIELDDFYAKKVMKKNKENPELKNLPKLVEADKHFAAVANSFEGFEESQLIYISPQEYLDLTKRFRPEKQSKLSKINSDYLTDLLKEGKELANYPYLYVKKDVLGTGYEVSGQEGIHRAIALKNMGYEEIPVVIQGVGKDKDTGLENKVFTATPRSYLYNQSFTQEYIGFIPDAIRSDEKTIRISPVDIREVKSKEILFDRTKKTDGGIVELLNL